LSNVNPANNKYFDCLNGSIGKKVIVKDVTKEKYEGKLIGFSAQHLNIVLKLESGNHMVLRNIVAFEIVEKENEDDE
jgi:small nuclear ribonucleoprotein (snRNP)-like protein